MKQLIILIIAAGFFGCGRPSDPMATLEHRVDSLESALQNTYKPGFGEFMSNVQAHHAKLWFAGANQNWSLAEFEIDEITETIEDVRKYQAERKESRQIVMIDPALDSVRAAIEQKDPDLFKSSYTLLTNTCNACHRATGFQFNVVRIPDVLSFSNQDFKPGAR